MPCFYFGNTIQLISWFQGEHRELDSLRDRDQPTVINNAGARDVPRCIELQCSEAMGCFRAGRYPFVTSAEIPSDDVPNASPRSVWQLRRCTRQVTIDRRAANYLVRIVRSSSIDS